LLPHTRLFARYFDANPPGYATTNNSGFIVAHDTVRGVDIAVYRTALRASDSNTTYSSKIPALCVEVLSPNDRPGMTHKRVQQYLAAGVPLVWVVQPDELGVFVHRPGHPVDFLEGDAELTAAAELPGFACRVSDFFAKD
jgi:Uma2 family endonuclease